MQTLSIAVATLIFIFSSLTVSAAERTSSQEEGSFFSGLFDSSLFGSPSVKKDSQRDVDVADKSLVQLADASSHKGATFTTKDFPPLCSDFIDPKDATKFSHCPGPVQPSNDKWKGYLEFIGKPGTARNLGQSDLFVPVVQDENDMTFFNLRGQMDDTDNSQYNVGFGHRHLFEETSDSPFRGWILGGYGYFDHRFSETDNKFKQLTFGVEALSENWDFRANGYIPENKTELVTSRSTVTIVRPGDQIKAYVSGVFEEKALPGFDVEVGYKLPIPKFRDTDLFEDTRLYLSGYHFIGEGNFESVTGPRLRLETRVHDIPGLGNGSRLMLGLETQYDDPRGSQTFGLVSLRIPFGGGTEPNRPSLKGLERRMLQPVIRDVDVMAPTTTMPDEFAPVYNEDGKEYVAAFDVDMEDMDNVSDAIIDACQPDDNACRMQEMVKARMQTVAGDDQAVLVFVDGQGVGGDVTLMAWDDMNIMADRTVASADRLMELDYVSETVGAGTGTFTEEGTAVSTTGRWSLSDGAQLNGWTVDASQHANGVTVEHSGKSYITNSTVTGSTKAGIFVNNSDAIANISNSKILNNKHHGIQVDAGTVVAENVVIESNQGTGVIAQNTGSLITIGTNRLSPYFTGRTKVSNNGLNGLHAVGGGRVNATDIEISRNTGLGVVSSSILTSGGFPIYGGSYIEIRNSLIEKNMGGLGIGRIHPVGAQNEIFASDVKIIKNKGFGAKVLAGKLVIENSEIRDNGGSGIVTEALEVADEPNSIVTVRDVTITGNKGYGLRNTGDQMSVTGSTFRVNRKGAYVNHSGCIDSPDNEDCLEPIRSGGTLTVDGESIDVTPWGLSE